MKKQEDRFNIVETIDCGKFVGLTTFQAVRKKQWDFGGHCLGLCQSNHLNKKFQKYI